MAYIALYRKWRPKVFGDLVGQENISKILKNQVINQRIAHAYLFSGGRGTGKTTTAKIFSRAVNCLAPKDGNPCNECEICTGILSGNILDVVEMDAASNNSVDDVRNIRDEVFYTPNVSKYRVYIIDEVHMLSTGAFNALLKILEEPPKHVIFILATTEPHKLPATILSRCQRFEFRQIGINDMVGRLKFIVDETGASIDEDALNMIANLSDGAMRDAISILDQCIDGIEKITLQRVIDVVGVPAGETMFKTALAIQEGNLVESLNILDETIKSGKDISQFISNLVRFFRDVLVFKATKSIDKISLNIGNAGDLTELTDRFSQDRLIKIITSLSELEANIKWATLPKILVEIEMVKLCSNEMQNLDSSIDQRLTRVEEALANPAQFQRIALPQKAYNIEEIKSKEPKKEADSQKRTESISKSGSVPADSFEQWNDILTKLKSGGKVLLYANLIGTKAVKINQDTIGIIFGKSAGEFGKSVLAKSENMAILKNVIKTITGQDFVVKCITEDMAVKQVEDEKAKPINKVEELAKEMDIPINVIDE